MTSATPPVTVSASNTTPPTQVSSTTTISSESVVATADGTAPAAETSYTIVAGDAVLSIARRFCVDAAALAARNGWPDKIQHPIFVGDVITVPIGGVCPVTTTSTVSVSETMATSAPANTTSQLMHDLVGRWEGPATVPSGWLELGQVWIAFDADGTYNSGRIDAEGISTG